MSSLHLHGHTRSRQVMWSGIAAALLVLVALLVAGWGTWAWSVATIVLLLSCVAACGMTVLAGREAEREVRRAGARLLEERRARDGAQGTRTGGD